METSLEIQFLALLRNPGEGLRPNLFLFFKKMMKVSEIVKIVVRR